MKFKPSNRIFSSGKTSKNHFADFQIRQHPGQLGRAARNQRTNFGIRSFLSQNWPGIKCSKNKASQIAAIDNYKKFGGKCGISI